METPNASHSIWYRGRRDGGRAIVELTAARVPEEEGAVWVELPMRRDLVNHSPDGPEWGYQGSGPSQLALAILASRYAPEIALEFYQVYKRGVIANLPHEGWYFQGNILDGWLRRQGGETTAPSALALTLRTLAETQEQLLEAILSLGFLLNRQSGPTRDAFEMLEGAADRHREAVKEVCRRAGFMPDNETPAPPSEAEDPNGRAGRGEV